jgi:hypothetical protein
MAKSRRRPRDTTPAERPSQRQMRQLTACLDAEARGDVDAALEHFLALPHDRGAPQLQDLLVLQTLGDDVPAWAWSRWIRRQAHRWLLFEEDPRIREAVLHTIAAVHTDLDALHLDDPHRLFEIGTRFAVAHWVTAQHLLYDLSGLWEFLECRATPALLDKADPMQPWVDSAIGGYRLVDVRDDIVELTDLADGSEVDVLNIGAATDRGPGATVIGRLVPTRTAPGLMFDARPLDVDQQTAFGVADSASDGFEWLTVLYDAVVAGRLPEGYGIVPRTPVMSDVVPDPPGLDDEELPGRVVDLVDAGLSLDVANAVVTCEVALIVADVAPAGLGGCAPHAALGLVHDVVFEAALEHCTGPEREQAWRRLALSTAEPVRSRCERLADACRPTSGLDPAA